ncbi:MAG: HypC/HybG/HupF family hydrogenase formation chaperone [Acidobacteria bacterium]|nr:HypC/HybG/HupF family hydrogenase formation chaperone [Acidobacteriota bacterium]
MCLAVPGKITEIYETGGTRMGRVNFDGITKEVCLAYLPDIEVGDYTIVHVGFAISKIDEKSALETLQVFREMGILEEELNAEPSEKTTYSFETSAKN